MPIHIIRPGECITSVAARYGVSPQALWQQNPELRAQRESPSVLNPGDRVNVPEPDERRNEAPFQTGGTVRYRVKVPTTSVRLTILDDSGAPLKDADFELSAGALRRKGKTDGSGRLEVSVPVTVQRASLSVWFTQGGAPRVFPLELGHLDPITEERGALQRLANLGLTFSTDPGDLAPALRSYQGREGLPVTGELDAATRARLLAQHGV